MTTEAAALDVFGLTDTGHLRSHNEDQFVVARVGGGLRTLYGGLPPEDTGGSQQGYLFVVADGVGGAAAGELASKKTVETLAHHIGAAVDGTRVDGVDAELELIARLEGAVEAAHERVRTELAMDNSRPASTATLVTLVWPRGYIFHVGDSRGYYLRGKQLKQFTRDQTVGEFMVDAGLLSEAQAEKGGLNEVLTHAIGGEQSTPAIGLIDFRPGDVLMLCSDGLNKHVSDAAIRDFLLRATSAEEACRGLVQAALAGGGSDNVTVIVARMSGA